MAKKIPWLVVVVGIGLFLFLTAKDTVPSFLNVTSTEASQVPGLALSEIT